ncbi:unnamed protein product, partial [Symbiodinium pilosum]
VQGPFTVRQSINLHKLLVAPIYVAMIWYFGGDLSLRQTWGPAAAALLICHGTYGFLWVYKDIYFPDASWTQATSVLGFISCFVYPLGFYYTPMLCLVSPWFHFSSFGIGSEPWILAAGLWFYIVGMFYHYCADLQKHVQLAFERPRRLITTELFAHMRNPNYFGEIMIYTGFAVLSMNWLPLVIFAAVWLQLFVPNMLAKEASMSRHAAWKDWVARTGLVYPWLPSLLKEFCANALSKKSSVAHAGAA